LHKRDVVFVTARVKRSQVKISSHPLPTGPIFKRRHNFEGGGTYLVTLLKMARSCLRIWHLFLVGLVLTPLFHCPGKHAVIYHHRCFKCPCHKSFRSSYTNSWSGCFLVQ